MEVNRRSYYKWCEKGKTIANNFDYVTAEIISKEHEVNKGIYGVMRLKNSIQNKLGIIFNHKLIRRYKESK